MSQLVPWSGRRKLLVGVAAGASVAGAGYFVYRWWLREYLEERWGSTYTSFSALLRVVEAAGAASELSTTVLADLKAFIESDSDEVPRSVRQMLKLSRSPEFQQAVLCSTQSVTEGVAAGMMRTAEQTGGGSQEGPSGARTEKGLVEVVLEKLFTEEGKGFASAVCSRMVRTLVASLDSRGKGESPRHGDSAHAPSEGPQSAQQAAWMTQLLDVLSTNRGKDLLTTAIQAFAVSGIGTFLDKTADVNMYHDMLVACGQNHALVKDLSAHVISTTVREALDSWQSRSRRQVHQVTPSEASSSSCSSPRAGLIPMSTFSESDSDIVQCREVKMPGMGAEMAQCLARPEVRSIILDITGVMTTKGMEAFLLVLMYKIFGGSPPFPEQVPPSIQGADVDSGTVTATSVCSRLQTRVLASRALAVLSVCLAVILHQISI